MIDDGELIGADMYALSGEIILDFKVGDGLLVVAEGARVEEEYKVYVEADSISEHLI